MAMVKYYNIDTIYFEMKQASTAIDKGLRVSLGKLHISLNKYVARNCILRAT